MQDLRITIVQTDLHWEDPTANMAMLEEKVAAVGQTDVIVLPEMFTTGFTMEARKLGEMMNLRTFRWMKQVADHTKALVLGSYIVNVHGKYYNRLVWMEPGGIFKTYDKRHLFRMAEENHVYAQGESLLVGHWKGWSICPLICYDLRFPVWSRNRWNAATKRPLYDVLVYVANWPQVRISAWDTLLRARAIENLSYVVGVNRVGTDGNGIEYNGNSAVIGPKGDTFFSSTGEELVKTLQLNAHSLQAYRDKFPAFLDADDFNLEIGEYEESA